MLFHLWHVVIIAFVMFYFGGFVGVIIARRSRDEEVEFLEQKIARLRTISKKDYKIEHRGVVEGPA